jgi:hypothetical protein
MYEQKIIVCFFGLEDLGPLSILYANAQVHATTSSSIPFCLGGHPHESF